MSVTSLKIWLQTHPDPRCQKLFQLLKSARSAGLPTPRFINVILLHLVQSISMVLNTALRVFIYTPAFKGRAAQCGRQLYLYGGLPFTSGPLTIEIGNQCRISGRTTLSGRVQSASPTLIVGDNVDIGWQTTIAVSGKVVIEDNVRIASGAFIFGYSGHSRDAEQRALGAPDEEENTGDIIIKRDAWIGTNVTICPNVTIGEGCIVGTGSVVTQNLADFTVAVGNPARVVRHLKEQHYA
ncbi:acyltransferase [Vibrio renipiscarius]|uniref:Acetyltransferase n=1 Tax=Vibrio renipiscarius TaxID=1461322 RepID=A0A0C2P3F7_9VIBR|nr:acyltransferase [Vibrio renipiscarius]KII79400.1 acetyltransferase [Vibrio renipiscarius]KII80972.1 acetyltransferase [Vibrio renipiscarius]